MKTKNIYWFLLFIIISFALITCKKDNNISLPTVKTYSPLYVASTAATVGCTVESDGGSAIIDCGLYIGNSQNPETAGTKLQIGSDTGVFLGIVTGLLPNIQYYIKAYAQNAKGESLGDQVIFTTPGTIADYDNNIYETVKISTQTWMAKNLRTTHYLNGDLIGTSNPLILDISNELSPKYQWSYGGDDANALIYGKLYTWYAITDTRKVCPVGWHIPADTEWATLESTLGGYTIAGSHLKETGNSHWISYNLDATNVSCFSALPGGYRNQTGGFSYVGNYGYWWSSTQGDVTTAWVRSIFVQSGMVSKVDLIKRYGASVRCIKD
jgi:uncharacterized protein (TIGR02145 family)